jgi:hypothetical protein
MKTALAIKWPLIYVIPACLILALVAYKVQAPGIEATEDAPKIAGTVTGKMLYSELKSNGSAEPMANVMVVLCRIPEGGLPEGPAISVANDDELEQICTLQGTPTALTDADGVFTLESVPVASYLAMFHPYPNQLEGIEWDGIPVTEAPHNNIDKVIPAISESDFWETGGFGVASAKGWSATEGFIFTTGNFCSQKYGICFMLQEKHPSPVVEVESNQLADIELTNYIKGFIESAE